MKKYAIVIGFALAAFMLGSCDLTDVIKTGGTIVVQNRYTATGVTANKVRVIEADDITGLDLDELLKNADTIESGKDKTYSFDKNGIYTVVALFPAGFYETVTLLGGNSKTVEVKAK